MTLDLWSTADDSVRIAAFLAIRKLATATDESILDMVLKVNFGVFLVTCMTSDVTLSVYLPHSYPFSEVDEHT